MDSSCDQTRVKNGIWPLAIDYGQKKKKSPLNKRRACVQNELEDNLSKRRKECSPYRVFFSVKFINLLFIITYKNYLMVRTVRLFPMMTGREA